LGDRLEKVMQLRVELEAKRNCWEIGWRRSCN
jgi:hypothetical protein